LVSAMIGRKLDVFYPKIEAEIGTELMRIEELEYSNQVNGVNLSINRGEIVAIVGAVGAGKTEILNCIYGILHPHSGRIIINDVQANPYHTPMEMIKMGIALIPEDRSLQGMIGEYTVSENISSVDMSKVSLHGVMLRSKEDSLAQHIVEVLDVRPKDHHHLMTALSGGNQQKIVLGKWLTSDYCIYLMDEVTAGVDIQAKATIYKIMGEIVRKGGAVLLCTGDIEEALGVADRIIVLFKGKVIFETNRTSTSKDELLTYIMGGSANA
ncbi:MAG: sugar ABC transporter ATP-binding protein, partial [Clostridia bacterium]|nr:sugar ABC transporter ATP-binding protein [Clostridia bacterium]